MIRPVEGLAHDEPTPDDYYDFQQAHNVADILATVQNRDWEVQCYNSALGAWDDRVVVHPGNAWW